MRPNIGNGDRFVMVDPEVRLIPPDTTTLMTTDAAFDGARMDIGPVVAGWLHLSRMSLTPMAVAEPHGRRAMLQNEVIEIVNTAETLHRMLHADAVDVDSAFTSKVKAALQRLKDLDSAVLKAEDRRKVVGAVTVREMTLERRLQQLAGDPGVDFCDWFFGGQLLNWAYVSSALRNALSHGYETPHKLEGNTNALAAVHHVTRSVVQLSLLVAAGLPTGASLLDLLRGNYHFRFVKNQALVDWAAVAAAIRTPARPPAAPQ